MDIEKLIGDITAKHGADDLFKEAFSKDSKGAILEHFGEEAVEALKGHLGDVDISKLAEGLFKK